MELQFNFEQKYVFFDTETEGTNLISSKPWQLSWITAVGKKIISKNDYYLKFDDLNVSPEAAKITGFNKSKYLREAQDPKYVFSKFLNDINHDDVLLCGHNILGFDVYIINHLMTLLGIKNDYSFISRCIDTLALSRAYRIGKTTPDCDLLPWQYKLINFRKRGLKSSQGAMLKEFNIDFDKDKLHNALYDIEKNFILFHELIKRIDINVK